MDKLPVHQRANKERQTTTFTPTMRNSKPSVNIHAFQLLGGGQGTWNEPTYAQAEL